MNEPFAPGHEDKSVSKPKTRWGIRISVVVVIASFLLMLVVGLRHYFVPTGSMSPTILPGSYLLAEKLTYRIREPRCGEIVVFSTLGITRLIKNSRGPERFIMRIAGIPGDELSVLDGKLFVNDVPRIVTANGKTIPYSPAGSLTEGKTVVVPEGQYFMLGDNSSNSFDSRMWGGLPGENIERRYLVTFFFDKNFVKRRDEKRRREYENRIPTN